MYHNSNDNTKSSNSNDMTRDCSVIKDSSSDMKEKDTSAKEEDTTIKDEAFRPLIDFHLTVDAAKLFAEHVSIWPGCFARYRGGPKLYMKLTDAERAARRLPDKVNPTDVVVSREGYIAQRTGNVTEPTPSQKEYMDLYARKVSLDQPRLGSQGHVEKPQYAHNLRHNRVKCEAQKKA